MGVGSQLIAALIGEPFELPPELLRRYPELANARYRRGGLPVRIGGWALGSSTAAAITLRRIIFLAPRTPTKLTLADTLRPASAPSTRISEWSSTLRLQS